MSIREFAQALRTTQGQHILASVLEGPEQGQRLLLCEGAPVWPPKPEGLLARNLPALAGCGASSLLTLEGVRVFVEKFGGTPRLVLCGGPRASSGWPSCWACLSPGWRSAPTTPTPSAARGRKRCSAAPTRRRSPGWRAARRPTLS